VRDKGISLMSGAKKALWQLQEDEHDIIIVIDDENVFHWVNILLHNGISFSEIAPNFSPLADLIIDNRQLGGFGGWFQMYAQMKIQESERKVNNS